MYHRAENHISSWHAAAQKWRVPWARLFEEVKKGTGGFEDSLQCNILPAGGESVPQESAAFMDGRSLAVPLGQEEGWIPGWARRAAWNSWYVCMSVEGLGLK